jgi:hypothetical protein
MTSSSECRLLEVPTYHLLAEVAADVRSNAPAIRARIPPRCTWTIALSTACRSLESEDKAILTFPPRVKEVREALKKIALSERPFTNISPGPSLHSPGRLPIKTPFPKHLTPPHATPKVKKRLRELAKENIQLADRQPYLRITASITERTLPTAGMSRD